VQTDVKEAFDNQWESCKTMGEYSIPAVSPIMDVFPYFSGKKKIWKK
jgi:hypothetical protein